MTRIHTTPEATQAFHGERVEARQAERRDTRFFADDQERLGAILKHGIHQAHGRPNSINEIEALLADLSGRPKKTPEQGADELLDLLFSLALIEVISQAADKGTVKHFDTADRNPEPGFDPSPFGRYWAKLNEGLSAAGKENATYAHAREAFTGGATPDGALTFIGKDWEGLRAIPAAKLDNGRVGYRAQFREEQRDGSLVWRTVHSQHDAIKYVSVEGALIGAKSARNHAKRTGE